MKIGTDEITKLYLGSDEVSKVYLGSDEVYGGGSPSPSLPYTELAYIENGVYDGTKTQDFSINLGIYPSLTMKVQIKGMLHGADGASYFGYNDYPGGNNNYFRLFTYAQNAMIFDFPSDGNRRLTMNNLPFGQTFELELGNCYIRDLTGTNNTVTGGTVTDGNPRPLNFKGQLYCWSYGDNPAQVYKGQRFYYIKIWDNDVLVRDLVPAEYNGEIGLWDKVNDAFYTNSFGGTITYGTL